MISDERRQELALVASTYAWRGTYILIQYRDGARQPYVCEAARSPSAPLTEHRDVRFNSGISLARGVPRMCTSVVVY